MKTVTPVVFRKFKDNGDIIALFPSLPWGMDCAECASYMHIGQHGAADRWLISITKPATPGEYADLLNELVNCVGYDDLKIYRKIQRWMDETRINDLNRR